MHQIGEKIKELRLAKKMTQSEFAERVNITKSTVSAYENGSRLPSYDVLIKIAALFHVTVDNLLGYSSKYVIDVSALTQKQRNEILSIVTTYERHNVLCRIVRSSDKAAEMHGMELDFEEDPG